MTIKNKWVYFLDTWDGSKPYEITFNLMTPLGILDRITYFEGGIINTMPTAYDCLVNILNDAGLTINVDYTISDDLKSVHVLGLIPICTHKEALQNVAFIANACIDDTRDGVIKTGQKGSIFTEFNQYLIGSMINQRINASSGFFDIGSNDSE